MVIAANYSDFEVAVHDVIPVFVHVAFVNHSTTFVVGIPSTPSSFFASASASFFASASMLAALASGLLTIFVVFSAAASSALAIGIVVVAARGLEQFVVGRIFLETLNGPFRDDLVLVPSVVLGLVD